MSHQQHQIKTYYPTMEQMKDFSAFMRHIHEDGGHRAGLAKIVPPHDYKPRKAGYQDEDLYNMEITCPIKQEVTGEGGLYQQLNLVEKKKMLVRNFKKLAETKHSTPIHTNETDIERAFWKNIFTNPSIYGADVPGSLYDDDCDEFNLTRLNTILDNIQDDYGVTIQGVNTTYLYFGMWKSSFCWHTEDMDLYSINYLHTGQPKAWYCIAPEYGKRFERLAASFFPHSFRTCRAFLRHKTTLISPQILKKYSIPFSRCTQNAGEFMVTFPYSYHSGFNHGFNIAEATNFALEYWIDFGKWATRCECSSESVKISMQTFVKRYQSDRYENWLRGKDICIDPRDPKHVAAAPKPTEYDLYLMGSHERETLEQVDLEDTKKLALQQNQSSNVKSKSKKVKKPVSVFRDSLQHLEEYLRAQDGNRLTQEHIDAPNKNSNSTKSTPSYCPIEIAMDEIPRDLTIGKKIKSINERPNYDKIIKKQLKRTKDKEEKMRLRREQRAKDRIVSSKELLHFLPLTFTHEKRFNRCISAQAPHCSVCQLFVSHPREDEDIWGSRELPKSHSPDQQIPFETPKELPETSFAVPQSTTAGPKVENFTLPESSRVLIPRGIFIRNPKKTWCLLYGPQPPDEVVQQVRIKKEKDCDPKELKLIQEESQACGVSGLPHNDLTNIQNESMEIDELRDSLENDSGYEEFLDVNLESSELLQCTVCMLTVHKLCYGLDKMPENKRDWICDRCVEPNRSLINCALCPCRGGALKTISDVWVHITCCLSVENPKFMDLTRPETNASERLKPPDTTLERNSCIYCSKNMNLSKYVQGKCITCIGHWALDGSQVVCSNTFHPTCGHRNGARFDYFDLHGDPTQKRPVRATCSECLLFSDIMDLESYESETRDDLKELCVIPDGTKVIAKTRDGLYRIGFVESYSRFETFDVFFPKRSEVELNINPHRIVDLSQSEDLRIGDVIKVRGFKEGVRSGKFKAKRTVEEYTIKFFKGSRQEKVSRKDIYLGVDELSTEQCDIFLKEAETPQKTSMIAHDNL